MPALNPAQARDALAALERLADFYCATGRGVSLLAGISEFAEASAKLQRRTMDQAVEGYRVCPLVNNAKFDSPECLKPA